MNKAPGPVGLCDVRLYGARGARSASTFQCSTLFSQRFWNVDAELNWVQTTYVLH